MKQVLTATCFAMACAVGLAAQQTTGTTGAAGEQSGQARPRTVTGCLRAGDTAGTYTLTDIQMGSASGGTTAGGGTGTTGTGTSTTTGGTTAGAGQMPTSLNLSPAASVDLKAHVGHKIEVTGTMEGGRRGGDTTTGTTGGGTTGGGTSTTGGETGQTTTGAGSQHMRTMDVTSVRMVSESCS